MLAADKSYPDEDYQNKIKPFEAEVATPDKNHTDEISQNKLYKAKL